jgi:hypothetical protein
MVSNKRAFSANLLARKVNYWGGCPCEQNPPLVIEGCAGSATNPWMEHVFALGAAEWVRTPPLDLWGDFQAAFRMN